MAGNIPGWATRGIIVKIDDPVNFNQGRLLETTAREHASNLIFGYPPTKKTTFTGYVLHDNGNYSIYRPKQWNHFCFAWSSGGKSKIVLV